MRGENEEEEGKKNAERTSFAERERAQRPPPAPPPPAPPLPSPPRGSPHISHERADAFELLSVQ
jgi:hypothetical protein